MSAEIGAGDAATARFDTLHAEAKEALAYAANTLRAVTERYREAFHEELGGWHDERDALDDADRLDESEVAAGAPGANSTGSHAAGDGPDRRRWRRPRRPPRRGARRPSGSGSRSAPRSSASGRPSWPASSWPCAALERTWLFLERGDASLLADPSGAGPCRRPPDADRRGPRGRADAPGPGGPRRPGPGARRTRSSAWSTSRSSSTPTATPPASSCASCATGSGASSATCAPSSASCARRSSPSSAWTGRSATPRETLRALTGATIEIDLAAPARRARRRAAGGRPARPPGGAPERAQARRRTGMPGVATRLDGGRWILEVRDDGRGFDPETVTARGPAHLRSPVHARAGGARPAQPSRSVRGPRAARSSCSTSRSVTRGERS